MQSLRQLAKPTLRQALRKTEIVPSRNGATKVQLRNTMDDLPVPSGSWDTQHKALQSKYNMHLAFGVVFATVTLITAKASGLFYLNATIPDLPKE